MRAIQALKSKSEGGLDDNTLDCLFGMRLLERHEAPSDIMKGIRGWFQDGIGQHLQDLSPRSPRKSPRKGGYHGTHHGVEPHGTPNGKETSAKVLAEPAYKVFKVKIVSGQSLHHLSADGKDVSSEPYVVCSVRNKKHTEFKTPTVSDHVNPEWNFSHDIVDCTAGDILDFVVWDVDSNEMKNKDDFLGKAHLDSKDFLANGCKQELKLDEGCGGSAHLRIEIASEFKEIAPVVEKKVFKVTIVDAHNLRDADSSVDGKDLSDPYVTCMVRHKPSTKFKTPTVSDCLNPAWNFSHDLVDCTVGDILDFVVFDDDSNEKSKKDHFLGKASLDSKDFFTDGCKQELKLDKVCGGLGAGLRIEIAPVMKATSNNA